MNKEEGINTVRPKMTGCYQKIFIFWGLGLRKLQTLSNTETFPSLGLGAIICKHPFAPVSPACNWGQGPILESMLP
jgi:hypothetical protein